MLLIKKTFTTKNEKPVVLQGNNVFHIGCIIRPDQFLVKFGEGNTFQDRIMIHLHEKVIFGNANNLAHGVLIHGRWKLGNKNFIGYNSSGNNIEMRDCNYIGHNVKIYDSSFGDNNVVRGDSTIRGCTIGNGVYIGPGVMLDNCVIADNAIILRDAHVIAPTGQRITIGENAIIGECAVIMIDIPKDGCIRKMNRLSSEEEMQLMLPCDDHDKIRAIVVDRRKKCMDFISEVWNHNMKLGVEARRAQIIMKLHNVFSPFKLKNVSKEEYLKMKEEFNF